MSTTDTIDKTKSNPSPLDKMKGMEYIELYDANHDLIKNNSSELINRWRDDAFDKFKKSGFPTQKLENYKYIDFSESMALDYGLNISRIPFTINPYDIFKCDIPAIASYLYFIVNDAFYPVRNQQSKPLPEGVIIESLRTASEKYPDIFNKYYNQSAKKKDDGWVAFNGTFVQDGFFIYVPKGIKLEKPIQIVDILHAGGDFMANSHNLVVLEENSKCQVLVCDHTHDDVHFFANRVTEVFVGENAVYEHYKLENVNKKTTHVTNLLINQQASSNVLTNVITLHNGMTRYNIEVTLDGENCETMLCGLDLGDKNQTTDNFTSIIHQKPNCHSSELFKYILDEESRGNFTGKLFVEKNAQKTNAYQTNRNILLSSKAKVRTRPQLEIYADDVKCSHGATTGQLDESAMFYMLQRGISRKEARLLLLYAFAADVIDNIRIGALKDRIKLLVEKRLRGEISQNESCVICQ